MLVKGATGRSCRVDTIMTLWSAIYPCVCWPGEEGIKLLQHYTGTRWRHQMETFSALLAICAGNSPVPGEFPTQRPVTRSFDVFFDLHPNKRLSKQLRGWWFETPSCPLWRHRNETPEKHVFLKVFTYRFDKYINECSFITCYFVFSLLFSF